MYRICSGSVPQNGNRPSKASVKTKEEEEKKKKKKKKRKRKKKKKKKKKRIVYRGTEKE